MRFGKFESVRKRHAPSASLQSSEHEGAHDGGVGIYLNGDWIYILKPN